MSYQAIQLDIDRASNVATITLNRPDKLNSFTRAMHRELQSALDDVEAAGARALILTGAGRGFCAGQDLADLDFTPGASTDLGALIDEHFNPLIRRLQGRAARLPTVPSLPIDGDFEPDAQRERFVRVHCTVGLDGMPVLDTLRQQGAGTLQSLVQASGLARLPAGRRIANGDAVPYYEFAPWLA